MAATDDPTAKQVALVEELFGQYQWSYQGLDRGCLAIYGADFSHLNRGQMSMVIDDLMHLAGRRDEPVEWTSLEGFIS